MPDVLIEGVALQDQTASAVLMVPRLQGALSVVVEGSPWHIKHGSIGKDLVLGVHDDNGLFDARCFTSMNLVVRKPIQSPDRALVFPMTFYPTASDPTKYNLRRAWGANDFDTWPVGQYHAEIDFVLTGKLVTAPDSGNFEITVVESLNVNS